MLSSIVQGHGRVISSLGDWGQAFLAWTAGATTELSQSMLGAKRLGLYAMACFIVGFKLWLGR